MNLATPEEIKEATERPDCIWLSFRPGKDQTTVIVNWDEINEINGDYGTVDAVVVVGIPLYGKADDVLYAAEKYVFNQVEIRQKIKENIKLKASIGCS